MALESARHLEHNLLILCIKRMLVCTSGTAATNYRHSDALVEKVVMADVLVAAIARSFDNSEIEKVLLRCVGMETGRLTLFTRDLFYTRRARSRMQFIPLSSSTAAQVMLGGTVHRMGSTLALAAYLVDANLDHLSKIGIPNNAAHRYNIAIDEGRGVVTYITTMENAALIARQFRDCGFVDIRRFQLTENFA